MERFPEYTNKPILLGSAVTEKRFVINSTAVHFYVPAGVQASVRFGSPGADSVPLQLGWQRFTFREPPGEMYLTASKGDPMQVLLSGEMCADFFSEGLAGLEAVSWLRDLGWPINTTAVDCSGAIQIGANGYCAWDRNNNNITAPYYVMKSGSVQGYWDQLEQWEGVEFRPSTTQVCAYYIGENALIRGPLSTKPGFELPGEFRVFWDTICLRFVSGTPSVMGFEVNYVMVEGAIDPNFSGFATNVKRWGVTWDTSPAGWKWFVCDSTSITDSVALSWPASYQTLVRLDFVHKMANASRTATCQLYVNGVLKVERTWDTPGSPFPIYGTVESHIRRCVHAQPEAVPVSLFVTGIRNRVGVIDYPSGLAIGG